MFGPCRLWGVLVGVGWPDMFVNCWGEEKVKIFFRCGVDGVRLAAERDVESLRGGVLALESLLTVIELVDG